MTSVYLDHAATTPMSAAALETYLRVASTVGNASSQHGLGRQARRTVEESREQIAQDLNARPSEIIFTSGGTEADNLAIKGSFWAKAPTGRRRIVISAIEHHAVLEPAQWLSEHCGADFNEVPVNGIGVVDADELRRILDEYRDEIAIVSLMWANNEVGTVQPLDELVPLIHDYGLTIHSDAVQALGTLPIDFAACELDAMTIGAHKIGGPVGVGALVARRELPLVPVESGGGQERTVRSGTVDVAGIAAFATAVRETTARREDEAIRLAGLRDELIAGVLASVPGASLRGPDPKTDSVGRLAANTLFTFDGCEGDSLIFALDSQGVCASTGSACQAGVPQASHVLLAMGVDEVTARGALRFSLGHTSTREDVIELLRVLPGAVERARSAGISSPRPAIAAARVMEEV
ncbi:cysteine desulfurase [Micrococcales bacterium KH10]|nr:cysteine desulfurase [Micrococcales bacterium KH10]